MCPPFSAVLVCLLCPPVSPVLMCLLCPAVSCAHLSRRSSSLQKRLSKPWNEQRLSQSEEKRLSQSEEAFETISRGFRMTDVGRGLGNHGMSMELEEDGSLRRMRRGQKHAREEERSMP
jgi:hypothetical protein